MTISVIQPSKFAVYVTEGQDKLPTLYWLRKLHKRLSILLQDTLMIYYILTIFTLTKWWTGYTLQNSNSGLRHNDGLFVKL